MDHRIKLPAVLVAGLVALLTACGGSEPDDDLAEVLAPEVAEWTGDLEGMLERRQIRVLVPYSRTFFFIDADGTQRGLSQAFMEAFEARLNERYDTGPLPVRMVYIPVTRDRLIPWLLDGRGDVIVANLTVTEARASDVLFTEPVRRGVKEVLVSGPSSEPLASIDELAGRSVYVREQSSFHDSLIALNERFAERGLAPVDLELAPDHFETGDVLEMLSTGVVELAVADDHLARFWARVLPDLRVHEDLVLRSGGDLAFAVRPGSERLKDELDEFLETHRAGTLFGNIAFERYLEDTRWVLDPERDAQMRRFRELAGLFQRFGEEYELDWLLLIAQGYQESRLDHSARSPAGAVGIMQVLPATAVEMGVEDYTELEGNIRAGARYLRWMIDRYYADEPMDEDNRLLFALASYNAGPRRVRELRQEAEAEGLDPDVWFDNVEYIAARRIGRETVDYVSNIFKYHVAFRLIVSGRSAIDSPLHLDGV
ncbi:transglycosylase SLT domain-containing protein [Wenzhouxiangella marina]|uniref:Transglycosylase SLT domain protein 3 n=1 Tax=Wenzhouxiangella marina TaxID=1579979 RepID=A0A0K0XUI7_9GAMM|nr:transporter substrate-binding domain-containing protein [Wenzhouxiangella marina]AKS41348.1 Transglycosylase SLT domain protein 3 [Wenzhouxiangella marina]MBB6086902.1 membrane-bound lytic murein transglycosylase MltF [Wenzhouxiangella marina]